MGWAVHAAVPYYEAHIIGGYKTGMYREYYWSPEVSMVVIGNILHW